MTYSYQLNIPTAAERVGLVVAPLEVLSSEGHGSIFHFCSPKDFPLLRPTVAGLPSAFSLFEAYLGAPFPYGCYKQVFIPATTALSSIHVAASTSIISSYLLTDEPSIEEVMATRIKQAHALAKQWFGVFITPESAGDKWLLEGLARFLLHLYIAQEFGNTEALYRRYKENEAVCEADVKGAPPLSAAAKGGPELQGIETMDTGYKLRTRKALAVVEMLEKQMGPESFQKVLQRIVLRAQGSVRQVRTLSTREFRHLANKHGNLERPILKEFFPRWVEAPGCPRLRMAYTFVRRRSVVEVAVKREAAIVGEGAQDAGMMTIRLHEAEGPCDHACVPLGGDPCLLIELPCHSRLPSRKSVLKKGQAAKADMSQPDDDGVDGSQPAPETSKPNSDQPLLWLRADPEREYLADVKVHQAGVMWVAQLERERDVGAQLEAIAALSKRPSFASLDAFVACMSNEKVFWRVRAEAATALALCSPKGSSRAGLLALLQHYRHQCFDETSGLPRPNDFSNLAGCFTNRAIIASVAQVRGPDGASPKEALEFLLCLLKHNDNRRNPVDDSYFLATLLEAVGNTQPGPPQNAILTAAMLKQLHRYLHFHRLVPSRRGVVLCSLIRALTNVVLRLPGGEGEVRRLETLFQPLANGTEGHGGRVQLAAMEAQITLRLEGGGGTASALTLVLQQLLRQPPLCVQHKLMKFTAQIVRHFPLEGRQEAMRLRSTLLALLQSSAAFNNVALRHSTYVLLQSLANRTGNLWRKSGSSQETEQWLGRDKGLTVRISRVKESVQKLNVKLKLQPGVLPGKEKEKEKPNGVDRTPVPPRPERIQERNQDDRVGVLKIKMPRLSSETLSQEEPARPSFTPPGKSGDTAHFEKSTPSRKGEIQDVPSTSPFRETSWSPLTERGTTGRESRERGGERVVGTATAALSDDVGVHQTSPEEKETVCEVTSPVSAVGASSKAVEPVQSEKHKKRKKQSKDKEKSHSGKERKRKKKHKKHKSSKEGKSQEGAGGDASDGWNLASTQEKEEGGEGFEACEVKTEIGGSPVELSEG